MRKTKGECEACGTLDVDVTLMYGNMMMCDACIEKEPKITPAQFLVQSRAVDESITLEPEIFLAKTVASVELRAAIQNNPDIPDDKKEYAYAQECLNRFLHVKKVVFDMKEAVKEQENEMRMWQVNIQNTAGKLRAEERAKFKEFDINYQPPVVKSPKPKTVKPSNKKTDKAALYEMAKKYDVPADGIRMIMVSRNMSVEDAAKHLHGLMNPLATN